MYIASANAKRHNLTYVEVITAESIDFGCDHGEGSSNSTKF